MVLRRRWVCALRVTSRPLCQIVCVRLHINLDEEVIARLDRKVGARRRSAFIAETVSRALEDDRRWDEIEAALSAVEDGGHEWDADRGGWVRSQRHGDPQRVG